MSKIVNIIGAGLAGCEAAWQLAQADVKVRLYEMKPEKRSPAHRLSGFAELVCSNSLRSNDPLNAAGLLKEEMRRLDSLVIEAAGETMVPAGKALAVDRCRFSNYITEKINSHYLIEVINNEIVSLDGFFKQANQNTIIATGPLTSEPLLQDIVKLLGKECLYFYDSVSPILDSSSIDLGMAFKASRYGYGGDDYWNIPLDEGAYYEFVQDILSSRKVKIRDFEDPLYFEGCLPIEIMAERGPETLRYGPMKPFGLIDPNTGAMPHAVVQLRQEDRERSMFSMVGFQTRLTWPEQERIFRKFPGLAEAKFLRHGVIHRNTYISSPKVLNENMCLKAFPNLYFAGQITGVEGYIESAAVGLWLGLYLGKLLSNYIIDPPPHTTATGSLLWHVANPNHRNFQPMNVNFGLMPIIREKIPKRERKNAMVDRAREDFESWLESGKLRQ